METDYQNTSLVVWSTLGKHTAAIVSWTVVLYVLYGGWLYTSRTFEDMQVAWDVERPIQTRSDLAQIPLIGPIYQLFCDATDWFEITFRMLKSCGICIPLMAAAPTAVVATRGIMSMISTTTTLIRFAQ